MSDKSRGGGMGAARGAAGRACQRAQRTPRRRSRTDRRAAGCSWRRRRGTPARCRRPGRPGRTDNGIRFRGKQSVSWAPLSRRRDCRANAERAEQGLAWYDTRRSAHLLSSAFPPFAAATCAALTDRGALRQARKKANQKQGCARTVCAFFISGTPMTEDGCSEPRSMHPASIRSASH